MEITVPFFMEKYSYLLAYFFRFLAALIPISRLPAASSQIEQIIAG